MLEFRSEKTASVFASGFLRLLLIYLCHKGADFVGKVHRVVNWQTFNQQCLGIQKLGIIFQFFGVFIIKAHQNRENGVGFVYLQNPFGFNLVFGGHGVQDFLHFK